MGNQEAQRGARESLGCGGQPAMSFLPAANMYLWFRIRSEVSKWDSWGYLTQQRMFKQWKISILYPKVEELMWKSVGSHVLQIQRFWFIIIDKSLARDIFPKAFWIQVLLLVAYIMSVSAWRFSWQGDQTGWHAICYFFRECTLVKHVNKYKPSCYNSFLPMPRPIFAGTLTPVINLYTPTKHTHSPI